VAKVESTAELQPAVVRDLGQRLHVGDLEQRIGRRLDPRSSWCWPQRLAHQLGFELST